MTEDAPTHDLAALRDRLLTNYTVDEFRELLLYARDPALRAVGHEFAPGDGLRALVAKALGYCERHRLLDALMREVGPAPSAPITHPPLDPAAVERYLAVVRSRYGWAGTRPYRQLSELRGAPPRLALLDEADQAGVYVPLRFDLHPRQECLEGLPLDEALLDAEEMQGRMEQDRSRTDVTLTEVLGTPGHVVLIGAAGCGKTTVLRLVAAVLASQDPALARQELGLERGAELEIEHGTAPLLLPVFIALREFEHACGTAPRDYQRDVDGLLHFLDDHFQRWHPGCVPADSLSGLVRSGRAWLLLDALDEVADFDRRIAVRQVIERLADAFPGNRLLVTARVAAYTTANTRLDERFHVAAVRDLTREQWAPLVERLYAGLEADPGVAAGRTRLLVDRIDAAPALQEMVKTPLMVWTATLIHYAERELPEQRAELYNAYVDVLLGERLKEEESAEAAQRLREERWPLDERRLHLTYAAYQVHQSAEGEGAGRLVVVDEQDLVRRILAPFMAEWMMLGGDERQVWRRARREAADFLAFMAERSGLLQAHQEGYSFGDHLSVQEFLAALYLAENVGGTAGWTECLQAQTARSRTWPEQGLSPADLGSVSRDSSERARHKRPGHGPGRSRGSHRLVSDP